MNDSVWCVPFSGAVGFSIKTTKAKKKASTTVLSDAQRDRRLGRREVGGANREAGRDLAAWPWVPRFRLGADGSISDWPSSEIPEIL